MRWLSLGEQNTDSLHRTVIVKKARHSIKVLCSAGGRKLVDPEDIAKEAVEFYKKLLGTSDPRPTGGEISSLQRLLIYRLKDEQQTRLV